MTKKIISVKKDADVKEIINLLTKHNISQVPVIEKNIIIGLVTESSILIRDDETRKTAKEIMTESPPVIAIDAKVSVIKSLLQFYPIILVKEQGKLKGVITKVDILKKAISN